MYRLYNRGCYNGDVASANDIQCLLKLIVLNKLFRYKVNKLIKKSVCNHYCNFIAGGVLLRLLMEYYLVQIILNTFFQHYVTHTT